MDIATIVGFGGGFFLIIISIAIGGNALGLYVDFPSLMIVLGGSFFALMASNPLARTLGMGKLLGIIFKLQTVNPEPVITQLVHFSESARKEGLLSLDDAISDVEDPFLQNGMRLVVDGTDPDIIKDILNGEIGQIEDRHQKGIDTFDNWGKLAPAFGMIGTLVGLIGMLANLADTSSIGGNMAIALITTLYGSLVANLFLMPIKIKLTDRHNDEMLIKAIMMEGVLSIQAGDNPRLLEQKLYTFLPPAVRPKDGASDTEKL